MNIFLTDSSPRLSALALDDKRVVKMALETAQMLSSACRLTFPGASDGLYRNTHEHHPCSRWSRKDLLNFLWLHDHGIELCKEYTLRFGRRHKSQDVIELAFKHLEVYGDRFPQASSSLVFDFDSSGWVLGDVFENYRLCMIQKWVDKDTRRPLWTYRGKPSWYSSILLQYQGI